MTQQKPQDAGKGGRRSGPGRQTSFPAIDVSEAWDRDKQTGEVQDHTEMLHSLTYRGSLESLSDRARFPVSEDKLQPGAKVVSKLSPALWRGVLVHLTPADEASLALSCKSFRDLLGPEAWRSLDQPENHEDKIRFLSSMDGSLPGHLLCFSCSRYHLRVQRGQEMLKPTNIRNPIFNCPDMSTPWKKAPRTRITFGRTLPFTFVQLALRAQHYSLDHGISIDSLSRYYKDRDSDWTHQTRYAIVKGHLLMRVVSTCFAAPALPPAGQRHLLYSPEDFVPYFSVCSHWRDGELMPAVKCALSHIPKPLEGSGPQRLAENIKSRIQRPAQLVTLCSECRPLRRCPECPTEYLIEVKLMEDRSDPAKLFKHALVVTRWSDLGDGSSPSCPEWASCNGEAEFDSFTALGRRAIYGVFESQFNPDHIPGQKIVSMNPKKEKRGEAGHNWY